MDRFRKSANKLRDQVVKQQHAVLKQLGGHASGSDIIIDEVELLRHQQLEKAYASTRAAKHFQREVVRCVEGIISNGNKQLEVANKLADECKKYGTEGPEIGMVLSKPSLQYGTAKIQMDKEQDSMLLALNTEVAEPLRAMFNGSPLEDARQLTQRYDRLRQEAEVQAGEVSKRRTKESGGVDSVVKLQVAETKMQELASSMAVLGKEATSAMLAVEAQQQRLTVQRIIALVHTEQAYHKRVAEILDQLQDQLVSELQHSEASVPSSGTTVKTPTFVDADIGDAVQTKRSQTRNYFIAEVTHPFEAESHGELSLSVGDFVVVRQVAPSGWSEGECKGQAGWFPSSYVEARQRMPGDKVTEGFSGV